MKNLTINQIAQAEFRVTDSSPVIKPFHGSFVAADPSVLTPELSPDGLWHIFFHTTFGVWHFSGKDGVTFQKAGKVVSRAMRPDINYIDGTYYLFFERTRPLIFNALNVVNAAKWKSEIYAVQSPDLKSWSKPYPVITHTRDYEKSERGVSISNPFYLRDGEISRLYYSCGLTYIDDCGFCEPTFISFAESREADKNYVSAKKPIIRPDKDDPHLNLCSGCLKVYRLKDGYIGIQNGIFRQAGRSRSAVMLLTSADGLNFEFCKMLLEPSEERAWMRQYVYASHLVKYGDELRLYFNARDTSDMIRGRECIGFAAAKL